jgi:CBS domain-containing protein
MLDIVHHQNPVTLAATESVQQACSLMRDKRVGAILVVEGKGQLIGVFTGRDAVCRVLAQGRDPVATRLQEVMTPAPITMKPGSTANDALHLMQDGGFRHIPVVDDGRIIGIVSKGDFRGLEQARLDEETKLWERI